MINIIFFPVWLLLRNVDFSKKPSTGTIHFWGLRILLQANSIVLVLMIHGWTFILAVSLPPISKSNLWILVRDFWWLIEWFQLGDTRSQGGILFRIDRIYSNHLVDLVQFSQIVVQAMGNLAKTSRQTTTTTTITITITKIKNNNNNKVKIK